MRGVHLVESQTLGLAHISRSVGHGQDVIGSVGLNERMLLLAGVQGGHQFASQVFLSSQDPESGARPLADFSGVGAHERGGSAGKFALRESEVEGKMVSFEAPAPSALGVGRSEDADVVEFWITGKTSVRPLEFLKNLLKAHNSDGLGKAPIAQSALEQRQGQMSLGGLECSEGDALAILGDEVPILPLVGFELEGRNGFLLIIQSRKEVFRRIRHLRFGRCVNVECGQESR